MSDLLTLDLNAYTPAERASVALPEGLLLRPLEGGDAESLSVAYLDSYPPDIGAASIEEARSEIADTFAGEFGTLIPEASLVASRDGVVRGAVLLVERSVWDEGLEGPFMIDLFLGPELRGLGVGRMLVESAVLALRSKGAELLSLRVGEGTSPEAYALYESVGFTDRDALAGNPI